MTPTNDLTLSTELLNAELPSPRFADDAYLRWLYEENPHGHAIQRSVDENGVRVAHYALIPQAYRDADGPSPSMFSLNAVTRSGTQRKGYFSRIGLEIYAEAHEKGRSFVVGVSNEKSVGAVVKYMGWRHWGPMPVRVVAPLGVSGRDIEHHEAEAAFLRSDDFARLAADLDAVPAEHWTNRWTPEYLRWRLSCPHIRYWVHASPELFAVSTRDRRFGIPAAVILKLIPRGGRGGPISPRRLIAAMCRHHRAPYAVYAGFNRHVPVRGIQPPRRLQPSPLHLIIRHLDPAVDQDALVLDTYEFLDGDAY
jgi:hypothetical protein